MSRQDEPATKGDLDQLKQELSAKIEANTAKIEANGKKIETNAAKIDTNTRRLDKLTAAVLKNRELIGQMVSRDEFNKRMDELVTGQDKMMLILTRLDQERVATNARLDRVEKDVEKNKVEIRKIKAKLGML